jgi:hypothetical protein
MHTNEKDNGCVVCETAFNSDPQSVQKNDSSKLICNESSYLWGGTLRADKSHLSKPVNNIDYNLE